MNALPFPSRQTGSMFAAASLFFAILVFCPQGRAQDVAGKEILYPSADFAKLDTFEGLNLEDADKLFVKKDYKGAFAAYKAYSFEFAKSDALAYVLLRMGRCLQLVEKRNAATKAYQDVVDYFPDDIRYAAAALYYMGECHGENGDGAKKTATWARMVKDDDYVTQPNSGTALTYLGKEMEKLGKHEEATEYHWRTAVAFVKTNERAAAAARSAVTTHYVQRSPNHDKLKEFYVAASGFDGRGDKIDTPEEDVRYWTTALDSALKTQTKEGEADQRQKVCAYWTAKMGDRFTEHDGLRKQWIDAFYASEKDRNAWAARLDKQFTAKPAEIGRVLQWCEYLRVDPKLRSEFFAKQSGPLMAGLKPDARLALMDNLRRQQMHDEAQTVMRTMDTNGMDDPLLLRYANFAANYETEEVVLRFYARLKDKTLAAKARFDYYHARSHRNAPNAERALAEIPVLLKDPKYAGGLVMRQAQLLQGLGRYEEAIKAYRTANEQPSSTWGVADCMVALKQHGQAVKVVQQIESVGGSVAAQASLKVADIYRSAGDKGKEVSQLRSVLKRYPKSGQSSEAHNRLESYGVALVGGESEAEE